MRDHDVTALTGRELEQARRELAASLALARPDSTARTPIIARIRAIDTELATRAATAQLAGSRCLDPGGSSRRVEKTPGG